MKVAILCGGLGARLGELGEELPKGLISVGGRPIVWHIMRYFATFGHRRFVLLVGHRAEKFFAWFADHQEPDWTVEFSDSGPDARKSDRLRDARARLDGEPFFLAYGDDVSDVDLEAVRARGERGDAVVTLTAVRPQSPFGIVRLAADDRVLAFQEKIPLPEWINGGFMYVRPAIFEHLHRGELEDDVLPALAGAGLVAAHRHEGFWMSMNTLKDRGELERVWASGRAPWRRWGD